MESLDGDGMLGQSCGAMGAGVMKYTIEHEMSGMKCFPKDMFRKEMMTGCYSTALMYTNLFGDNDDKSRYGEILMLLSIKESRIHVAHFSNDVRAVAGRLVTLE